MNKINRGVVAKSRHKKVLKNAKGFYGARSRSFKSANQSVIKALQYAYRDRRVRKRNFRSLWITRINAIARQHGLTYNSFMHKLKTSNITLNRKVISDMAIFNKEAFEALLKNISYEHK